MTSLFSQFTEAVKWNQEQKRIQRSNRLVDLQKRTTKMYRSELVRELQCYCNDITSWLKSDLVSFKDKADFFEELVIANEPIDGEEILIRFIHVDGFFGKNTFESFKNILESLNEDYVNTLREKNLIINSSNVIYPSCISRDIEKATFHDLNSINRLFIQIRNDLYKKVDINDKSLKVSKTVEKTESLRGNEEIRKSEYEINKLSHVKELEKFCDFNAHKFEVIQKDGSTIITLNGEELPKTTDRSKDFHNGYIEGFRRCIVLVQRIMQFRSFTKREEKARSMKEIKEKGKQRKQNRKRYQR